MYRTLYTTGDDVVYVSNDNPKGLLVNPWYSKSRIYRDNQMKKNKKKVDTNSDKHRTFNKLKTQAPRTSTFGTTYTKSNIVDKKAPKLILMSTDTIANHYEILGKISEFMDAVGDEKVYIQMFSHNIPLFYQDGYPTDNEIDRLVRAFVKLDFSKKEEIINILEHSDDIDEIKPSIEKILHAKFVQKNIAPNTVSWRYKFTLSSFKSGLNGGIEPIKLRDITEFNEYINESD